MRVFQQINLWFRARNTVGESSEITKIHTITFRDQKLVGGGSEGKSHDLTLIQKKRLRFDFEN